MYRLLTSAHAVGVVLVSMVSCALLAQDKEAAKPESKPGGPPSAAEMAAMMELAKPGENHKLLAQGVGTWTYKVKAWMNPDPTAPPSESSGIAVVREVLGGRYFIGDHAGKMQMAGADGKMMDMDFKGMSIEGYDNMQKKFISAWIDNMGTGIMNAEGDYDAASKTLTYHAECSMMPGPKTKIREVIKLEDKDHHTMEFYEDRGEKEVKTMEIKYTRKN